MLSSAHNRARSLSLIAAILLTGCGGGSMRTVSGTAPAGTGAADIIPRPMQVTRGEGTFQLRASTTIRTAAAFQAEAGMLAFYLRPGTGFPLSISTVSGSTAESGSITLVRDAALESSLGSEGYRLTVTEDAVLIEAAAPAGAFYGIQTLRQLLPASTLRAAPISNAALGIPAMTVEDKPRFVWRGAHLDVSRHFMPKEFVKKYIDLLALHKMNSFHWHLTDDQGWRIEIKRYPKLTEVGAWRSGTLVGPMRRNPDSSNFNWTRHGGFYTQDDIREVVAYARARHINVVPEIEMPGHAQEVIAAYPELGSTTEPAEVRRVWGVSEFLLNPSDSTIQFLKNVMLEVLDLFPSTYIHVGGDEAVKTQWRTNPIAQARIRELGLADENELQSWFIHQFDTFLNERGRRLVGWDEILEGGLAPNAVVMSWRGTQGGIAAARDGHDVIMTPTSHTYFDYYQAPRQGEPLSIGGFLPIDTVYSYEPVPAQLEPQFTQHILGAQAQLWTEYMPNAKHVEYMAYPRMAALAEVVWTRRELRNFSDFSRRLSSHFLRLDALDVNYRRPR